jgi:hypothetical protein
MNRYVALIRLGEARPQAGEGLKRDLPRLVGGVIGVRVDAAGSSACVWFDRTLASLTEIVRAIESFGIAVTSVAQTRDPGETSPPSAAA